MILGQRHLGNVVEHQVDTLDCLRHHGGLTDVSLDELDIDWAIGCVVDVEHTYLMAGFDQMSDEQRAEVAAAPGDERPSHSSMPCWMHQRMLRRMPSYNSTCGS